MTRKNTKKKSTSHKEIPALKKKILKFLTKPNYEPVSQEKLFSLCGISKKLRTAAVDAITELLTEGSIDIKKKKISIPTKKKKMNVTGTISVHPRGFGFVTPEAQYKIDGDIFIPKPFMNGAIDKDVVEIEIVSKKFSDKGPEGVVKEIIERTRKTIVGIIFDKENEYFLAYSHILKESKIVHVKPFKKTSLKLGDIVILKVEDWSSYPRKLIANVESILSHIKKPTSDIETALIEHGLSDTFPQGVVKEAKKFPIEPTKEDLKDRFDLTKEETFTIDPDTAKDFDDALSLKKEKNGDFHLIVHIADVSHYVKKGSLLDEEAYKRSNSTYFPGKCIPMLPEELSNGLCSLKENVLRLTVSVFMHFDSKGNIKNYDIRRSYIKSNKRFTYKQALKIIEGKLKSKHEKTILLMVELCNLLQGIRNKRGSVDLSLPEVSLVIGKNQDPSGVELIEYDITHQLVEEFMLKANEIVAHSLLARNSPAIFRVHDAPSDTDSEEFYALARMFGFKLKKSPTKQEVQKLFESAKNSENHYQLCIAFIRSMKLAIYSEDNVGHFGLCLEHYTHFTSPIRRYSDLVIHRLLFEESLEKKDLKEIATHCSDKERVSFRAESSVILLKKLRLLKKYLSDDPDREYEAFVTKVKHFGFYFEVYPLMFEGFIHISEIGRDYFHFDDKKNALIGRATNQIYNPGKRIKVLLKEVDFITHESFWKLINSQKKKKKK
ncbi:MAG: Ribonuclease R [Chlamydiia bacterium]|nr:Ribonuclease R [Chlamydiia bacterium]